MQTLLTFLLIGAAATVVLFFFSVFLAQLAFVLYGFSRVAYGFVHALTWSLDRVFMLVIIARKQQVYQQLRDRRRWDSFPAITFLEEQKALNNAQASNRNLCD